MTAGSVDTPREITDGVLEGKFYPNHEGIRFMIIIKKILKCLGKWDLNV